MMGAAAAAEGGSSVTLIVDNSVPANARAAVREAVLDAVDRSTSCRFLEPPPLSTDELVVAVGCKSLTDQCAKALGATLKVDHVLLATAAADGNLRVSINPPRKKDLRAVVAPLTPADGFAAVLRARLQPALGQSKPARLVVQSEPAGLAVRVAGKVLGNTPLTVETLGEGHHALEVGGAGYVTQTLPVDLQAGQQSHLQVTAVAAAVAPVAATPSNAATPAQNTATPAPASPSTASPSEQNTAGGGAWRYGVAALGAVGLVCGGLVVVAGAMVVATVGGVYGALYAHGLKLVALPVRQRDYVAFDQNRLVLFGGAGAVAAVAAVVGLAVVAGGVGLLTVPWLVGGS